MNSESHVLFEFNVIGNSVKVTAVDESTKIEVSTIVPRALSREDQIAQALAKLRYVMKKT